MVLGAFGLVLALSIADETVLRAGKDVPAPQRVDHRAAAYPELAGRTFPRLVGIVALELGLSEQGRVVEIKILRGTPILDAEAVEAAKKWTYTPTLVDGVPRRVALVEVVEMFPDDGSRSDYFLDMLKNRKEAPAYRLLALERLGSATGKKQQKLQSILSRLSKEDPDERIRAAAAQALGQPGEP